LTYEKCLEAASLSAKQPGRNLFMERTEVQLKKNKKYSPLRGDGKAAID